MLKDTVEESDELDNLQPDADLSELGINSVTFMRIVIAIEMEFDVEWDDADLNYDSFSTINKIVTYIQNSATQVEAAA